MTGALIGYCANKIAVKSIFWPHTEIRVFGRKLPMTPGLFVARRKEFAASFADAAVERFCGPKDVLRVLGQVHEAGLDESLSSLIPKFVYDRIMSKLGGLSVHDITLAASEFSAKVRDSGLVSKLVVDNIEELSAVEIESMVRSICGKELRSMALFDAAIGFMVGCVQGLVTYALST